MANLNLTSSPTPNTDGVALSASHNPIQFRFQTDAIGSPNYAYAWVYVQGPTILVGTTFEFNGTTYTASDNPAFGEFKTTTASTRLEVAQSMMLMLRNDPNNYEYEFQVSDVGAFTPMLYLQAKKAGSLYNMSIVVSAGLSIFGIFVGSDQFRGQSLQDYKVWATLIHNPAYRFAQFIGTPPSWSPGNQILADYDLAWSDDNTSVIDIAGVANTLVDYERPNIAIGIHRQESAISAFFLEYGEKYIPSGQENEQVNLISRSDVVYVLNSALPTLNQNDLSQYYQRQPAQKLLTTQPTTSTVRTQGKSLLSFIWYHPTLSYAWIGVYVQAVFYDGSTAIVGTFSKTQVQSGYHTVRVDPESWAMTSFENSQGKLVQSYQVYLVESLNPAFGGAYKFSELRTYIVDRVCLSGSLVEFVWLEPIGGWASYSFYGELVGDVDRSPSLYDQGRKNDFDIHDQMLSVSQVEFGYVSSVTTAEMDFPTFSWLRDSLLKSPVVYIVSGSSLIPIVIVGHEAKSGTNDFTFSLGVTFNLSAPSNTMRT